MLTSNDNYSNSPKPKYTAYKYTPPTTEVFEEIKEAAIKVWQKYDNTYGYVTEKVERIKRVNNNADNAIYLVNQFDQNNQHELLKLVGIEAKFWILKQLVDDYE